MPRTPTEPESESRAPSWIALAAIGLLVAGMVAGAFAGIRHWRAAAIEADCEALAKLPDDDVPAQVRRLAEWGDEALPRIAALVGDERPAVAEAARRVLRAELKRWRELPEAESTPKVQRVARELAYWVEDWNDDGRQAAAEIARRCIAWPLDAGSGISPSRTIADCEAILQAAGPPTRIAQAPNTPAAPPPFAPYDLAPLPPQIPLAKYIEPMPSEPPAAAPIAPPVAEKFTAEPFPLSPDTPPDLEPAPAPIALPMPGDNPLSTTPADLLPLLRQLADPAPAISQPAEKALRTRGFTDLDLAIARRAASPRAAERLALLSQLPGLPCDARPWLLFLSDDSDLTVRSRAKAILATSRDENLRR